MDGYPSSLNVGDIVKVTTDHASFTGEVMNVHENGAFIGGINEFGIRTCSPQIWCEDSESFIEECNGESMF